MAKAQKETVFVGLSGGVDSSVSALRLKRLGYDVVGVFIKTWAPDFLPCTIEEDRLDAMRVAAKLGIPFYTLDAEEAYERDVADYMIAEYRAGRTPNPDVMCNRYVKFGVFLNYARAHGGSKIATGHYARVEEHEGRFRLYRGKDPQKDQSYFLWTLTQAELGQTLFPVGDSEKPLIRLEAERYSLSTAEKSDSQGICFLGEVDMQEFLSHYIDTAPGAVLDESGKTIGTHEGAVLYTIGQRHGFTTSAVNESGKPRYVVSKDLKANTITVGTETPSVSGKRVRITEVNVIERTLLERCEAQFRYRQKPFPVTLVPAPDGRGMLIGTEATGVELPALGQSCVLYDGEECLGGGIVSEIL